MEKTNFKYGCIPSPVDIRDYKVSAKKSSDAYPKTFELEFDHSVKNQGDVCSCVAHATSSILEYHEHNKVKLSTNFIYGIRRSLCKSDGLGMYLRDACKIVQKYGDMLESDCPGNNEVPECFSIAEQALKNKQAKNLAANFRILSYYVCTAKTDVMHALMNYGPVLFCVKWHDEFIVNPDDGLILFNPNSDYGYHAVMCYGWNENGWLCQNSWGESFGKDGCFVLPFSYGYAEAKSMTDYNPDDPSLVTKSYSKTAECFIKVVNKVINFLSNIFK